MKKIIHIVIWSVLLVGFLALLGYTKVRHNQRPVSDVSLKISYDDARKSDILITYPDIEAFLAKNFDSLHQQSIGEININELEQKVMEIDYVNHAEAFMDIKGKLNLTLSQRRPIIRVMLQNGESFYLDEYGKVLPIRLKHPSKLIVCNGSIGNRKYIAKHDSIEVPHGQEHIILTEKLNNIYILAKALDQNEFLATLITQVFVNDRGEFELTPLIGSQRIILGDISRLDEKLNYLETFYKQETQKNSLTQYRTINLKFKNQVVCTKK